MKYSVLQLVYKNDNLTWFANSVESMLNQSVIPKEYVIVVNGKVNAQLSNIISSYKKKYPRIIKVYNLKRQRSIGLALSFGLTKTKHNLVARMDSDDISLPNRCEEQLKCFDKDKDLCIIGSNILEFKGNIDNVKGYRVLPEKHSDIKIFSKRRCPFNHMTVMLKKDRILEVNNYKNYNSFEDYDLWIKLLHNDLKSYNIQKNLVFARINDNYFKRRGGLRQIKSISEFKLNLFKDKYINLFELIVYTIPYIVVYLMPIFIRKIIYFKLLRKSKTT